MRELLDKKCLVMSVTTDQLIPALAVLKKAPKLIITDSQVFGYVYENKPAESMLTSFSVLFAAYKGDLPYYVEGAEHIDALNAHSRILIAECCTHAPLKEDIGREKIPRMLRKRFGDSLAVDIVSGTDFPEDLSGYDLIIQCGADIRKVNLKFLCNLHTFFQGRRNQIHPAAAIRPIDLHQQISLSYISFHHVTLLQTSEASALPAPDFQIQRH